MKKPFGYRITRAKKAAAPKRPDPKASQKHEKAEGKKVEAREMRYGKEY